MITYPIFEPKAGVKLDSPEQFIRNNGLSPYSRNMEFYQGRLQSRLGLAKFSTQLLPDPVLFCDQYWQYSSTWYLMVCTKRDIAYYDFGEARFSYLTPIYNTGTIEIKTGELNKVYGNGTTWTTNLKAGDFIKIGAGALHTGSTWYEILTVDSNTLLTLKTNAVITTAGTAYEARKTFGGLDNDLWCATSFTDIHYGRIWIATNGVDTPIRWAGTGQVVNIAGLEHTAAKFVNSFKDRVIWMWTVEGGQNQPVRIRWSAVGDCEDNDAGDFRDCNEGEDWITNAVIFSNYFIVFKERKAYIGRWVGGTYTFDFDISNQCVGCFAPFSVVATQGGIFYYGVDNKFHFFNIISDISISDEILSYVQDFNPQHEGETYGYEVEFRNQIRWACPHSDTDHLNAMLVFDYNEKIWQIWEYANEYAHVCVGSYILEADLYVDDPVWGEYYVDEQEGFWDERTFLSGAPVIIYGGRDGYIRQADIGTQDDGVDYTRTFRTKRLDFKMPDYTKRLWKQQFWFESSTSGSVIVKLKKGDSENFEALEHTISLIDASKDIIKSNITWDKESDVFQNEIESTNHFALIGFLSFLFPKRKTC